jgi:hypothetical protein
MALQMITNEQELEATQEPIARFQHWLADFRRTARPTEFDALTGGYRLEIERMQAEVLDYLLRPAQTPTEVHAA